MANDQNLIPFAERPERDQREIRSKGGKASVAVRRKKKLIRETLLDIMSKPIPDSEIKRMLEDIGMETTFQNALALSGTIGSVQRGRLDGLKTIWEMIGENKDAADRKEQRARIKRLEEGTSAKNSEKSEGHTLMAELVNVLSGEPAKERNIHDLLGPKKEGEDV